MPRSKHATLLAIATGALALYTLLAVAVYSHIATRERMDVRQSVDNMGWAGSHFQTEFYKFEQRLSAYAGDIPGVDPTEVQLRFDILLGRLETLGSGAQREAYGDNAELAQTYELIRGKIAGLEPVMASVIGGDKIPIPSVLAVLRDLEPPVAKLANGISRFAIAERARLGASILRASHWLGVLLIGQIITLLLLGSFLWRQFSELQRSQASLEASNKALVATQADVRRNEYRFRQFFNNMRDIIVCMGTKGQSDFGYDAGGVLLLGRDVDRIAGTRRATTGMAEVGKWYDAVHPEDLASYKEAERRRKENGEAYSLTYRFTHPETGEQRWAAETGWATKDLASDAVFFDSYILDVTEHMNLERQIRENRAILQSVIDNSPIIINVKDRAGRYVLVNRHMARMFGTTPDNAVGRFAHEVHAPTYRNPRHEESHWQVVKSGEPILGSEEIFAGTSGDESWITNKAPVKDAAGEVRHVVTVSMPVPQLAMANKALAESRAMLLEAERQAKIVSWNQPLNSETGTVWSENITEILGLPPECVSNDAAFLSYVHAEDRERVRSEFARATENPEPYEIDYRFVRPNGRTIWLRSTAKIHLDKERPGSRLIGTNQDITAQKTVELALRESKLHLHAAQRRARMAYWTWDIAAGESYVWSDEAADILGLPPGAVPPLDKDYLNLIHPDDRGRIAKEYDYTLTHYNEFEFFYRVVRPDGRTIWIRELAEPITGANGRPVQMIGTIQDVTSQKQIEEALRQSEARLRGFMDHAPLLISLKDPQERYQLVNRELVEFLGVAEDTIVGRTVFDVFPRHIAERLSEDDRSVLADGKVISREFSETETYSRYSEVSVTKFPIRDAEGRIVGVGGITLDISERKRAEQALRGSESRLRSFMHNAPVGMIIKSTDLRFLMANPFVARAYNKPETAFLGHRTSDLTLSEGARDIEDLERMVVETGKATSREVFFADHTASPWTHQVRFPIFDENGVMTSIGGFAIDITERKNAEMARRESESLFRSFLENSPAGMAVKDRDGRFLLVNRYVEAEFGLPAKDILGRRSAEIAPAEAAEVAESMDRQVLESGQAIEREIHLPARSDFEWTYTVKFPIKDANGRITAIGGFGFDIGERKRVELALRESESRLRRAQQQVRLAYWSWQIETEEYQWAPGAGLILGVADRDLPYTEAGYLELIHPDDRERIKRLYDEFARSGSEFNHDFRIMRPDGAIVWMREIAQIELDAAGRRVAVSGTIQDITEQHNLEEQLRQSQKMEAIGQLTGGIAHDFNNLLAVVLGNLELVTEQIGDNKKLAKGIDNAIRASLRGADLTQRLLAFARRQVLAPVATDVNALIADMRDLLIRPLGPTIEFSSVFANEVWPIEIDQSQLEAALLNMALNARDAMPEGGRLTIKTSNAHVSAAVSGPGGELQPGDYVLISVSDTGGGMSDAVKSRAFDPFYTTKSLGKGTGLGLSMVYGFVKQSGGHIAIDSEIGVGTTMMIYLPRAGDGGAAASAKAEAAVPRAHGETILVLEDEAEVAAVAQRYLVNLGYKVIVTGDAESAMAKLASAPRVDLLLADVILGGRLDGRAVAKQALARWPNLKVMFMSGYAPNGGSPDGDGEPTAIHIAKPFQKADLARELRRVLDRATGNHQG